MKTLIDYINESRMRVTELPFSKELFNNFMQHAILDSGYDDTEEWKELEKIVSAAYGVHVWKWFTSWTESYLPMKKDVTIDEFYDMILNIPLDRISRVLGAGSNGIVLDCGDKVIKIYYSDHIKNTDEPFLKWCMKHESHIFPKVYKMGKNWAVMEKVKMHTKKVKEFFDIFDGDYYEGESMYHWINCVKEEDRKPREYFKRKHRWVYDWCMQCKKEMEDMNCPYISFAGDLFEKNVGERDNGDIIYFDI